MERLSIDLETYSDVDLIKCGMYKYVDSPAFEILLFAYSIDGGDVKIIDFANGETLPDDIRAAITSPDVVKTAYNAQFERVCLSRYLGLPQGEYLDPASWYCTMVQAAELSLPASLADVGAALGLERQKLTEGKELIKYFCVPCRPTKANGGRKRNMPQDAPDKWEQFKTYCKRDVDVERQIAEKLKRYPISKSEHDLYVLDQRINDRGVLVDLELANQAVKLNAIQTTVATEQAYSLTGLENPNSVVQLKAWLTDNGVEIESLSKKAVAELADETDGDVSDMLKLRLLMSKTSVKKYEAVIRSVCTDSRVRGMLRFYGANRLGRWPGNILQPQNLPRNYITDLTLARDIVKSGDYDLLDMAFENVPNVLSELIRTALVPKENHRFIIADFSAIEARVLAWIAGEEWRLDTFRNGGDIYCASASKMFHVPVEKHGVNGHLRQKGKISELACGYGGGVGALKSMGAVEMGVPEDELQGLINDWRGANPHIVKLWYEVGGAAMKAVREKTTVPLGRLCFIYESGILFIRLPSGRRLSYIKPRIGTNRFGSDCITYMGVGASKKLERLETFGGKLVENCVAVGTLVVTNRGLVPIQNIRSDDCIWDGIEFVQHDCVINKGIRTVVQIGGLQLTPEHKILTQEGWKQCGESDGFKWADVSLPYSDTSSAKQQFRKTSMAMPMRMRKDSSCRCGRFKEKEISDQIVRMHEKQAHFKSSYQTRHESSSGIWGLAFNETVLRGCKSSRLSQLWRTWHNSLQKMAAQFREFLGGHGFYISERDGFRPYRKQQRILTGKLQMGFAKNKRQKQTYKSFYGQPVWKDNRGGVIGTKRNRCDNIALSDRPQLADRITVCPTELPQQVYDIRNCGKRHRFAVWDNGKCRIVSNCTQAIARDLLASAMMNVSKAGYNIVFHVHDEIIAEMPDGVGSVDEMSRLMCINPDWANGLPLNADGYECEFYRKD